MSKPLHHATAVVKILIIKPSSLGDIIHGLQVAALIRRRLPDARIDWVARDVFAPLVRRARCVDSVFEFSRSGGASGFLRLMREIRAAGEYDWVFDMQGLARSALMALLTRGKRKAGRPDAREGAGLLLRHCVRRPAIEPAHALERLLPFAAEIGIDTTAEFVPLEFQMSADFQSAPAQPYILLFPESRRAEKEWPHFDQLGPRLASQFPSHIVVWSGADKAKELPGGDSIRDLRGCVPLADLPQLIAGAALVVANDSGPMHISAAMARPTVAVFGPTDPSLYGPWPIGSQRHRVVVADQGNLDCLNPDAVLRECFALMTSDEVH